MTIREGIEALKIIAPFAQAMADQKRGTGAVLALIRGLEARESQVEVLRLVALMYHKNLDDVAAYLRRKDKTELTRLLMEGFATNDIAFMVVATGILGLAEPVRWTDGRR